MIKGNEVKKEPKAIRAVESLWGILLFFWGFFEIIFTLLIFPSVLEFFNSQHSLLLQDLPPPTIVWSFFIDFIPLWLFLTLLAFGGVVVFKGFLKISGKDPILKTHPKN